MSQRFPSLSSTFFQHFEPIDEELNRILAKSKLPLSQMQKFIQQNPLHSPANEPISSPQSQRSHSSPPFRTTTTATSHTMHSSETTEVVVYPSSVSLRVCIPKALLVFHHGSCREGHRFVRFFSTLKFEDLEVFAIDPLRLTSLGDYFSN